MTTQAKHTPGPWSIEAVKDYMRPHDTGIDSEIPESIANAHLIAAAPEMLEALRAMVARAPFIDQSVTEDGLANCEALLKARRAIRHAEGEQ
jgi:hypothetical protein